MRAEYPSSILNRSLCKETMIMMFKFRRRHRDLGEGRPALNLIRTYPYYKLSLLTELKFSITSQCSHYYDVSHGVQLSHAQFLPVAVTLHPRLSVEPRLKILKAHQEVP